jgi:Fur family ferric uptake transcriptional regulator
MIPDRSVLQPILRAQGYSVTAARQLIVQVLWEQKPQTMAQIVDKVDGRIDRVSIYRTIKLFEQLGLVQRVNIGWKYQIELAGPFSHHHHHLTCINCHKVVAMSHPAAERLIHRLAAEYRFTATQHQLEIQGYCQQCQAKQVSASATLPD